MMDELDDMGFEELPDYDSPANVGDEVTVVGTLCGTNSSGGTEILKHSDTVCLVTRAFWDYETGWRFVGKAVDPATVETFRSQSEKGVDPEAYREKYPDNPDLHGSVVAAVRDYDPALVYFSEHDLAPAPAAVPGL